MSAFDRSYRRHDGAMGIRAALKAAFRNEIQRVQPQMGYLDAIREVLPRDGFFVEEIC